MLLGEPDFLSRNRSSAQLTSSVTRGRLDKQCRIGNSLIERSYPLNEIKAANLAEIADGALVLNMRSREAVRLLSRSDDVPVEAVVADVPAPAAAN